MGMENVMLPEPSQLLGRRDRTLRHLASGDFTQRYKKMRSRSGLKNTMCICGNSLRGRCGMRQPPPHMPETGKQIVLTPTLQSILDTMSALHIRTWYRC